MQEHGINTQQHASLKLTKIVFPTRASCHRTLEAETGRGIYVYSSCLCLLVTALSFTTTAGSDKLKEFARVAVISTAITKFN